MQLGTEGGRSSGKARFWAPECRSGSQCYNLQLHGERYPNCADAFARVAGRVRTGNRAGSTRTAENRHEDFLRLRDAVRRSAQQEYLPGVPRPAGIAAGAQSPRPRTCRARLAGAKSANAADLAVRAQKLFLSGFAEG